MKLEVPENIIEFFNRELAKWELARKNVEALELVKRKSFDLGNGLKGYVQYNPARKVSTIAKTDPETLRNRKCFLCPEHRFGEQNYIEIIPNWHLLINPYPIFKYHFTIASKHHIPQTPDFNLGVRLAKALPGMTVFFNDVGAGASVPDHFHFQAVPNGSFPFLNFVENGGTLPFKAITGIIKSGEENSKIPYLFENPVNMFFTETDEGISYLIIPRKTHRPSSYFLPPPERRLVSPGAADIVGVLITPEEEDFEKLNDQEITEIFRQVTFPC